MVLTSAQMFWDERVPRQGDLELYRQLLRGGERGARTALTPDAGLWEYREREEVHTFSAAMCWAEQHRLGMIAKGVGVDSESREWLGAGGRAAPGSAAARHHPGGRISGVLDRDMLDACLVLPEIGLLGSTIRASTPPSTSRQAVMKNGFMMRYSEADDFGKQSKAFLLCTFWSSMPGQRRPPDGGARALQ